MVGRNHAMIGGAAGAAAAGWAGVGGAWLMVAVAVGMVAALLPDLDSTDSLARTKAGLGREQIRRNWRRGRIGTLGMVGRELITLPANLFARFVPHRGPTHWLLTCGVLTLLAAAAARWAGLPDVLWVAFGAGYLSHIVGDGLTISGVPMLGPLTRKSFRLVPRAVAFRTGSAAELMVVPLVLVVGVGYFLLF